jgi:hypothetical protein
MPLYPASKKKRVTVVTRFFESLLHRMAAG